jgi:hypothetical protein
MYYNYTFQAYHLEKHQKDCLLRSSEETMFLFGTGFNDINQRGYFKRNPKYNLNSSLMKH